MSSKVVFATSSTNKINVPSSRETQGESVEKSSASRVVKRVGHGATPGDVNIAASSDDIMHMKNKRGKKIKYTEEDAITKDLLVRLIEQRNDIIAKKHGREILPPSIELLPPLPDKVVYVLIKATSKNSPDIQAINPGSVQGNGGQMPV